MSTLLFVHGTGTRLKDYWPVFETAQKVAASVGIKEKFVDCVWGDPLGIEFNGLSLPVQRSERQMRAEEEDFLEWRWRFEAPLLELERLTPDAELFLAYLTSQAATRILVEQGFEILPK